MWRLLASTVAGALALVPFHTVIPAGPEGAIAHRATATASGPAARPPVLTTALTHLFEEVRPAGDGRLAIANRAYQATFSADDGVVYLPRTEESLDSRRRWQYRVRTLETDTARTVLGPAAPTVSPEGDHIVDFVRPGIVERYVGKPDGVEQVFVLASRPSGDGDVRIRGDVTFAGTRHETESGIEFRAQGRAPFSYARPVAFDADRTPVPVRVALAGGGLDLVVDAAALRSARFPVTIDPLFGATDVKNLHNYADGAPDVAYNSARDEFLVVFNGAVTWGTGFGVHVRRFHSNGDALGESEQVAYGLLGVKRPSVAYDQHLDRYLVVWSGGGPGLPPYLQARILDSNAEALGGPITIVSGSEISASDVAARNGYHHGLNDLAFVVTFAMPSAAGTQVWRAFVTGIGGLTGTHTMGVVSGEASKTSPSISYDPRADRFLVVWQQAAPNTGVIGWTLTPATGMQGPGIPVGSASVDAGQTAVAYDCATDRYLVVYSTSQGFAGRFVSGGQSPLPLGSPFLLPGTATVSDNRFKDVAAEPGSFVVSFVARTGNVATLRHQRWLSTGLLVGTSQVDSTVTAGNISRMAVAVGQQGHVFGAHPRITFDTNDTWIRASRTGRWFAHAVHGASGDFTGDGKSDLFLFRPTSASVHVWSPAETKTVKLANQGGIPVLLDWDGDGLVDLGVFRPSTGVWFIRLTGTGAYETVTNLPGQPGDIPVPGDYLGNDADEVAVFRPSTGKWYIRPRAISQPSTVTVVPFGQAGDIPVPADWDGDGKREIGVFRQTSGQPMWHLRELDMTMLPSVQWGSMGDIPLHGQFVGSPDADQVVYRRAEGKWYIRDGATGAGTIRSHNASGVPMPLDYNGDGTLELVLFEEATGTWSILGSSGVSIAVGWGMPGDLPAGTN